MASLAPAEKAPSGKPLKVGSPHDPAEREADRIADLLTAPEEPALPVCSACAAGGAPCAACGGGDGAGVVRRQVAVTGEGSSGGEMVAPPSVHRVLSEPGEPLPQEIRGTFEKRLGLDLAPVRLHTGPDAARAAAHVNARAFAFGHHVPLGEEAPVPTSQAGKRLLAHEVAHVAMGHAAGSLRRNGPPTPASGGANAAAATIIDRLEGYTSAGDSEAILAHFRGQGPGQILAIMEAIKSRGPQHGLDAAGMVVWLLGDLTEENRRELRGLLARSGSPDMCRILVIEIKDRLDGYTSEADSTEILAAFSSFSSGISTLLSALETAMRQDETSMRAQLFGDLDRVNAERLRQLFFAQGGSHGIDYATSWTAEKIESLLAGWTGHSDSSAILSNLQSTPAAVRPLLQHRLEGISQRRWSKSAEDVLMEQMDRADYGALRQLEGVVFRAYDREPGIGEMLLSGLDWGLTVAQWLTCGLAGIITGVLAAIWDLVLAIKGVGVAIWDLLWSLVYLLSAGAAGSANWLAVKTFFTSLGTLFSDPGRVWDQYWQQKRDEFTTIEGPFSDCRRAEYLVRTFVVALVNIALIFLAGYGLAKGAASAVRGVAQAAELAEVIGVGGAVSAGARLAVRGLGRFIAASAEAAQALLRVISRPVALLRAVGTRLSTITIAARDMGYWSFLQQQARRGAGALGTLSREQLVRERLFWEENRRFWQTRAELQETRRAALAGELETVETNLAGNRVPEDPALVEGLAADARLLDLDVAVLEGEALGTPARALSAEESLAAARQALAARPQLDSGMQARLQALEERARRVAALADPEAAATERAAIARDAAALRVEAVQPELVAEVDRLLRMGPPTAPATSPRGVAQAVEAVRRGTATQEQIALLARRASEDARAYLRSGGDSLSWDVVRGSCGIGRDCSAASLGSLLHPSQRTAVIRRFQSLEVFGVNKHGFTVVEVGGESPHRYLVDPTFAQFMRPGSGFGAADATAQVLRTDPEMLAFARDLLRDGFVPLNQRSAQIYARALGVSPEAVQAQAARLLRGEAALTSEVVGGAGAERPIGAVPDTANAPDILDAAELRGFVDGYITRLRSNGDPDNLLPTLTDLRLRLDSLVQPPGPGAAPAAVALPGGERRQPEPARSGRTGG